MVQHPGFIYLICKFSFQALTLSLFGPHIFEIDPDFVSNFWAFNTYLPNLAKGWPRWLTPASHRARDKMKEHFKKWHEMKSKRDADGGIKGTKPGEENFGSKPVMDRHAFFAKMGLSEDTIAAEDLHLLWA
jgi:hypothetical protein